jgi:hypothetical protein
MKVSGSWAGLFIVARGKEREEEKKAEVGTGR